MKAFFTLTAALMATSAFAQEVTDCADRASVQAIAEPWEEHTKTFANGDVRLALLDFLEPAAGAYHLMILSPPRNELGDRQCRLVGFSDGIGYANMDFAALEAAYDPAEGLIFTLPAIIYLPEQSFTNSTLLRVSVNQSTGHIGVTQELGGE